ncbi:MAG: 3-deoxy-D-manno-octulosonic acid transferase [Gammaproteobacteria bacterium]|nr:3-deoxy-D-manno-octulosonic acid transferase [Gammaproteobacteria bacterium]
MRRIYTALWLGCLPLILGRLAWQALRNPAYRDRWRERLGCYRSLPRLDSPIWVHAVSVGEVGAAAPLIRELRERYPFRDILITTTTPTGAASVARQFGETVHHAYFPYDIPWAVSKFLRRFKPRMLLLIETELWPNVLHQCTQQHTPVVLVNGRMSERSARRYRYLGQLVHGMLAQLTMVAAQTLADAERLRHLGVPRSRLAVTGSLKFDVHLPASIFEEGAAIRRELGVSRPVLVAGSTREGEEIILLRAFRLLRHQFPDALLVVAPRHPERFEAVAELIRREGWHCLRRRDQTACGVATEVFLLDSMGELLRFYAAADVAFVGGSLMPLGGHNMLEPASLGVPVVTGPHVFNFLEISSKLVAVGALRIAADAPALVDTLAHWLANPDQRDDAGLAGRQMVAHNRGATVSVLELLANAGLQ